MRYLAVLLIITPLLNFVFDGHIREAGDIYPSIFEVKIERSHLLDFWFLLLGSRRAASDYAWIRLLQYYGTHFEDDDEKMEEAMEPGHEGHIHIHYGKYYDLKYRSFAALKLDPFFKYAYLYAGGALAFNQERFDDAAEVLRFGIKYLPRYWKLQLYLSAISYKQSLDYDGVTRVLAESISDPDCPMLIKNILALLYEKKGDYAGAKKIWLLVLAESKEEGYIERAKKHLEKISKLYNI